MVAGGAGLARADRRALRAIALAGMSEKKSVAEMSGEFLREAGVLVGVFGFLDELIEDRPLRQIWLGGVVTVTLLLVLAGVALERYRKTP